MKGPERKLGLRPDRIGDRESRGSLTWEQIRKVDCWVLPQIYKIRNSELEVCDLWFNKPSA